MVEDDEQSAGSTAEDGVPAPEGKKESEAQREQRLFDAYATIGSHLPRLFEERYNRRKPLESRWLQDMRAYYGQYDPDVENELKEAGGSRLFVNLTRPKTNAFAARMMDMLLPTEDRNWGIGPTPVPEGDFDGEKDKPVADNMGNTARAPNGVEVTNGDLIEGLKAAAKEAAEKMERQIDDRLTEAGHNSCQRKAIQQMAMLGTGVIEGPIQVRKEKKTWTQVGDLWQKVPAESEVVPTVEWVDLWDFFPDMNSSEPEEWRDGFRRYYMNGKTLRERAEKFGFNKLAVEQVLAGEERRNPLTDDHLAQLRSIQGLTNLQDDRYMVLKYVGPMNREALKAADIPVDDDVTTEYYGIVWLCENVVLRVDPYPLDSNCLPWSVCYAEKDSTSPFGWGIPRMMRGEQKAANAAFRMMVDNGGLSAGPQLVVDPTVIVPADGRPGLRARKVWHKNPDKADVPVKNVFDMFTVDSHQAEMMNIFNLAMRMADEVTQLPLILEGEQATHITKTAQGMSILNNNANIVLKRAAKLYDDYMTTPLITRMFEWEMQFNPDNSIKGDHQIVAKGATVLLEKEMQAQSMMQLMQFKDSAWDAYFDWYKVAKESAKTLRIGDIVPDESKVQEKEAQRQQMVAQAQAQAMAAKQGSQGGVDPAEIQDRQDQRQHERDMAVMQYARDQNLTLEDARKQFALKRMEQDHDAKKFNAELAVKMSKGSGI